MLMGHSLNKRRDRKEQDYRNAQLMSQIKEAGHNDSQELEKK
jgi:hypothetical protein